MQFTAIDMRLDAPVCTIRLDRQAGRGINPRMVEECRRAVAATAAAAAARILVLEGGPRDFCGGADLDTYAADPQGGSVDPDSLYDLWQQLSSGPFISIAFVRGRANAGGLGFAAACDIVLAGGDAKFSLSELLFGLIPACVLPFLIRRIGRQRAHYMALSTHPIGVEQAAAWGLVDAWADDAEDLLRKHLVRLRRLPRSGLQRYRAYLGQLDPMLANARPTAVEANRAMFSDPAVVEAVQRYVRTGSFPWEA